jgi:hypothetical protein
MAPLGRWRYRFAPYKFRIVRAAARLGYPLVFPVYVLFLEMGGFQSGKSADPRSPVSRQNLNIVALAWLHLFGLKAASIYPSALSSLSIY